MVLESVKIHMCTGKLREWIELYVCHRVHHFLVDNITTFSIYLEYLPYLWMRHLTGRHTWVEPVDAIASNSLMLVLQESHEQNFDEGTHTC